MGLTTKIGLNVYVTSYSDMQHVIFLHYLRRRLNAKLSKIGPKIGIIELKQNILLN